MGKLILPIFAVLTLGLMPVNNQIYASEDVTDPLPEDPVVLISGLQTRGVNNAGGSVGTDEFVELYNASEMTVSLDGWRLKFTNKSGSSSRFIAEFNDDPALELHYEIEPGEYFIVSRESYLAEADFFITLGSTLGLNYNDGTLQLLDESAAVVDMVGYGMPEYYLGAPAPPPAAGQSIHRCFNGDDIVDTRDNSHDFHVSETPQPGLKQACTTAQDEIEDDEETDTGSSSDSPCEEVVISEIFANPEGAATGRQFIEIYNPTTDIIDLAGCGLQSTHNDNIYWFNDITLSPGSYRAFYDYETDVWLTISSGGTVFLLNSDTDELYSASYPAAMPDDAAWAWLDGDDWALTYTPTPNALNEILPLRPCPEGQSRNPETNRCRNVVTATSSLIPCEPGRERNPETNRCRNIAPTTSELADCGPGRERNPDTNRCRKIAAATSELVPCGPDQERNPETNRCRRVGAPNDGTIAGVKDIKVESTGTPLSWWVAGVVVLLAAGYGVWEWRYDIRSLISRRRRPQATSLN